MSTSARTDPARVRVTLPLHLQRLAGLDGGEVTLTVERPVTQRAILSALEARFPTLLGTVRDPVTHKRRPLVRFHACTEDHSHDSPDDPLPEAVASGEEPFHVIGAIAGG